MSTTAISSSSYFGATAATPTSSLDMSSFLNLLTTQLENQDPTQPMDDASFYAQIAQLGQVQGLQQLNETANLQQAQELLGKTVTATRPANSDGSDSTQTPTFTGVVQSITYKDSTYYLNVNEDGDAGTVQIQQSAIQSVVPTVDVASMSNLIGKTVAGSTTSNGTTTNVIGTVVGITAQDGQAYAQVKDSSGTTTAVPVSTLSQIATASSS